MPKIRIINPLHSTEDERSLLRQLPDSYPDERVFQRDTPYLVNHKFITLTHTLIKYPRKKNPLMDRLLVVDNSGESLPIGKGSFSQVYTSRHTLKDGENPTQKNPEKERVIKFQNIQAIKDKDAQYLPVLLQGSKCAESLPWLHHKQAIHNQINSMHVEIERRIPGVTLWEFTSHPLFDACNIDQLLMVFENLLEAHRIQLTRHNIVHRDIHGGNILIEPETLAIKLIDFGFAKPVNLNDSHYTLRACFPHNSTVEADISAMGRAMEFLLRSYSFNNPEFRASIETLCTDMRHQSTLHYDAHKHIPQTNIETAIGRLYALKMWHALEQQLNKPEANEHIVQARSRLRSLHLIVIDAARNGLTQEKHRHILDKLTKFKTNPALSQNIESIKSYNAEPLLPSYPERARSSDFHKKINPLEELINILTQYKTDRTNNHHQYKYHFLGMACGYSRIEKINAVNSFIDMLNGKSDGISDNELKALRNGTLGDKIRAFVKQGHADNFFNNPCHQIRTIRDLVQALNKNKGLVQNPGHF